MAYRTFFWIRTGLAVALLVYAGNTIYRFASEPWCTSPWEAVFWSIGPPLWFFAEYLWFDHGCISLPAEEPNKETFLKSVKDYADYASKIWAAVLAAVLFLYPKK